MTQRFRLSVIAWVFVSSWIASDAVAQPIGTFRWQLAPHCNVVTLTVVQVGSGYTLQGFDDRCGATTRTGVSGTAHLNPDGTVGLGMTFVWPNGFSVQTSAIISFATVSGTWSDPYGGSGNFVFNPPGVSGSPRAITIRGNYAIDFVATALGVDGLSAISFGQTLPAAPQAPLANFIVFGGAPTTNCPGSATLAEAAPGHLCIYEKNASGNIGARCIVPSANNYVCNAATRSGASVYVESNAAGRVWNVGAWAVTVQ